MSHEHNYSMPYPEIYPTFGFEDSSNVASLDRLTKVEVDHVPPVEIITEIDSDDWDVNDHDNKKDPHWQLPKDEKPLSRDGHKSEGEIESEEESESPDTDKKYWFSSLVWTSCSGGD